MKKPNYDKYKCDVCKKVIYPKFLSIPLTYLCCSEKCFIEMKNLHPVKDHS